MDENKRTEDSGQETVPGTSFPANIDGGGTHWPQKGTQLIQCPALQINIFSRLCKTVRDAKYSDPFPQCASCPQRTDA